MEWDGFSIMVTIGAALFFAYWAWYLFLVPLDQTGQVSSFSTSYPVPLFCTQNIEFYGGGGSWFLCNEKASIIEPNLQCHIEEKGMFLLETNCLNKTI